MSLTQEMTPKSGWKRKAIRILLWLAGVVLLLLALIFYFLYSPVPPEPALSARPERQTMRVGALDRSYLLYAPARPANAPPLLVIFHSSMGSSADMRVATGYEFDRLADQHGFVVVYPQGYQGHWNDCRKAADYSARRLNIDDVGFFEALVARLQRERNIDPARVFVSGLSNGGHFVFRLALERPDRISGAAVFAANLPTAANSDCVPRGLPPPIMIVNGTSDPINPYDGGVVTIFGFGNRGTVLSSLDSARYFAGRAGAAGPTTRRIQPEAREDRTWVDQSAWRTSGTSEVVLLSVNGGGHVVPQPVYRPPRLLGRATTAINGPSQAWEFFRRQEPSRRP